MRKLKNKIVSLDISKNKIIQEQQDTESLIEGTRNIMKLNRDELKDLWDSLYKKVAKSLEISSLPDTDIHDIATKVATNYIVRKLNNQNYYAIYSRKHLNVISTFVNIVNTERDCQGNIQNKHTETKLKALNVEYIYEGIHIAYYMPVDKVLKNGNRVERKINMETVNYEANNILERVVSLSDVNCFLNNRTTTEDTYCNYNKKVLERGEEILGFERGEFACYSIVSEHKIPTSYLDTKIEDRKKKRTRIAKDILQLQIQYSIEKNKVENKKTDLEGIEYIETEKEDTRQELIDGVKENIKQITKVIHFVKNDEPLKDNQQLYIVNKEQQFQLIQKDIATLAGMKDKLISKIYTIKRQAGELQNLERKFVRQNGLFELIEKVYTDEMKEVTIAFENISKQTDVKLIEYKGIVSKETTSQLDIFRNRVRLTWAEISRNKDNSLIIHLTKILMVDFEKGTAGILLTEFKKIGNMREVKKVIREISLREFLGQPDFIRLIQPDTKVKAKTDTNTKVKAKVKTDTKVKAKVKTKKIA